MSFASHPPADVLSIAQQLRRNANSHKGTFGRALLIGGCRGMSGAVALAGMAALRGGAGLVQIATSESAQPVVASFDPCFLTTALPEDAEGRMNSACVARVQQEIATATAGAIGPGLGRSRDLDDVVSTIFHMCKVPLVVDADALNALAEQRGQLSCPHPRILTPHPGEFARLCETSTADIQSDREDKVREFFAQHAPQNDGQEPGQRQLVLVLKGHETIIADGTQVAVNETGNPGMATGGSGDVLTGLITALLAQGISPFSAARLGVWLHGAAGDLAADDLGQISMTASDLLDYLPSAFGLLALDEDGLEGS